MTLTHSQARRYYDWFGSKQDSQDFYTAAVLQVLVAHADFEHTNRLFALRCGAGR